MSNTKKKMVIYHSPCPDGLGAAWAAFKKLGHEAEYVKGKYEHVEDTPDLDFDDKDVYMLDFMFKNIDYLKHIANSANSLTIIDHHKTNKKIADAIKEHPKVNLEFDMEHSGAVLSWMHFFPNQRVPQVLLYIEDRDIWKWEISNSKEFLMAFDSYDVKFDTLDLFSTEEMSEKMMIEGKAISRFHQKIIDSTKKKAVKCKIRGTNYTVMALNEPHKEFVSALGNAVVEETNMPCLMWGYLEDGRYKISLRSKHDLEDVAKMAEEFGGGGHRNSSGFVWDGSISKLLKEENEKPWWRNIFTNLKFLKLQ